MTGSSHIIVMVRYAGTLDGRGPKMSVPMRTIEDCLTEELRRIDPDEIYAEVINEGWDLIRH